MFNSEYTKLATVEHFGPIKDEPGWCLLAISTNNQIVRQESLRFLKSLPETMARKAYKKDKSNRVIWAIHQQLLPLIGQYFLIEQFIEQYQARMQWHAQKQAAVAQMAAQEFDAIIERTKR